MKLSKRGVIFVLIATAIIIRFALLFFAPISMFADPVIRYLPDAERVLKLDFSFHDFPLFTICEAVWMLLLSGKVLWLAWKLTSLIFFIAILFLLPSLFKKFNLDKKEQILALVLFLFSTWSLLLSVTLMQEMMLTFLVLALYLSIENYFKKPSKKWIAALVLLSAAILLTKATGYILLSGFGLYALSKKRKEVNIKRKINSLLCLLVGVLLAAFWPVKNYIISGRAFIGVDINPFSLHSSKEYLNSFILAYHYFWEIPLSSKVAFSGKLSLLYNIYYIAFIIAAAIISACIIIALFKYYRKYKEYIFLMLPIGGFALVYWTFLILLGGDAGRYTFPFWIFLFIFAAKFIAGIKIRKLRLLCYVFIALFCLASVASATGIIWHMHDIDTQILQIDNFLKGQNVMGSFVTNDEFTSSALGYYLGQPVVFSLRRNIRDVNVPCAGEPLFFTKNFDVFMNNSKYAICRWNS